MSTMVPMYGFGGGSGGTGAALTVTAPAGATVTVSKDGKTKTKVAGADGAVVFKGLENGTWRVSLLNEDGSESYSRDVAVTADYTTAVDFFDGYLYNAGDEREAFTGGWYCDDSSALTKTAECMTLRGSEMTPQKAFTSILFDTTGFTKITVDWECNNAYAYFGIADANKNTVAEISMSQLSDNYTLDISGYPGEYLLYFGCKMLRAELEGNIAVAYVYSVKIE